MGLQQISYAFHQCKNFENRLRCDKVTVSLKVGTFFETQCRNSINTKEGTGAWLEDSEREKVRQGSQDTCSRNFSDTNTIIIHDDDDDDDDEIAYFTMR